MGAETRNPFSKNLGYSLFHYFLKCFCKETQAPSEKLFATLLATSVSSSPLSCPMVLDHGKI